MSLLFRSFALYEESPRLNRGKPTPGPGLDLTTWFPYVLFRCSGLFGLRAHGDGGLDVPFILQDEGREKRFAGRDRHFAFRLAGRFFAGPFARLSASSSEARSSDTDSTESPERRLAFVSPSVT